jgi:hypothetical protein
MSLSRRGHAGRQESRRSCGVAFSLPIWRPREKGFLSDEADATADRPSGTRRVVDTQASGSADERTASRQVVQVGGIVVGPAAEVVRNGEAGP